MIFLLRLKKLSVRNVSKQVSPKFVIGARLAINSDVLPVVIAFQPIFTAIRFQIVVISTAQTNSTVSHVINAPLMPMVDSIIGLISGKKVVEIDFVMIGSGVCGAVVLLMIVMCSLCHRKKKRRRSDSSLTAQLDISQPKPPQFEIPPSLHFLPMDSV